MHRVSACEDVWKNYIANEYADTSGTHAMQFSNICREHHRKAQHGDSRGGYNANRKLLLESTVKISGRGMGSLHVVCSEWPGVAGSNQGR